MKMQYKPTYASCGMISEVNVEFLLLNQTRIMIRFWLWSDSDYDLALIWLSTVLLHLHEPIGIDFRSDIKGTHPWQLHGYFVRVNCHHCHTACCVIAYCVLWVLRAVCKGVACECVGCLSAVWQTSYRFHSTAGMLTQWLPQGDWWAVEKTPTQSWPI